MSEEENKAIVLLTELRGVYEATAEDYNFRGTLSIHVDEDDSDAIKTILELVEKQQKELEDYKSGYFFTAKQMHYIDEDYISKDKIIDKIKEIGSETQYLLNDKGETKQNYAIRKFYELLEE